MSDNKFLEESIQKVDALQVAVVDMVHNGITGDPEEAMEEYYHMLYALMQQQGMLYTRLQLLQDPRYATIQLMIHSFCCKMGMNPSQPVMDFHWQVKRDCIKGICEITGDDPDELELQVDVDLDEF